MLELTVLNDIIKTLPDGKQIVVTRNVKSKIWIQPNTIKCVSELVRDRSRIFKNKCEIYIDNIGVVIVAERPSILLTKLADRKIKGYV